MRREPCCKRAPQDALKPLGAGLTRYPLLAWNATKRDYPRQRCIGDLVSAKATANPQGIAVVGRSLLLTYGELEAKANKLAHYLLSLGAAPEIPVGLCLSHSANFVIGALGILKAGGAYLSMDPAYPAERLALMLKDTGAPLVVTDSCQLPRLSNGPWKTISMDGDAQIIARESCALLTVDVKPGNLAYLTYTSGSTGKPKAVEITHGSFKFGVLAPSGFLYYREGPGAIHGGCWFRCGGLGTLAISCGWGELTLLE